MKILQPIILLFFCSSILAQLPGAEKFAKTITQKDLKEHLYIYASDEFEGRETGSEGQKKAVNYIKDFYIEKNDNNKISLKVNLKYYEGDPVIKEIKRISKPGRRVYSRANSLPRFMNGLGLAILSTPKGVMSDTEARKNNVGGEIICKVF